MPPIRRRRGPYKQYIFDQNVQIPRSTAWLRQHEDRFQRPEDVDGVLDLNVHNESDGENDQLDHGIQQYLEGNGGVNEEDTEDSVSDERSDTSNGETDVENSSRSSSAMSSLSVTSDAHSTSSESDNSGRVSSIGGNIEVHVYEENVGNPPEACQHQQPPLRAIQHDFRQDNDERRPLYQGSQLSTEESDILIMSFIVRWGLHEKCIEDLLRLIDCHMPVAAMGSKHLFLKKFPTSPSMKVRRICPKCSGLLPANVNEAECECGHYCDLEQLKQTGNFFVQLSAEEQIKRILAKSELVQLLRRECDESDVINGKVYKKLKERGTIGDNDLTIQFNVDGVKPFKSSKVTIYPIQACINELPYHARREHMILCGLYYGKDKPSINAILKPFVEEFEKLHSQGMNCIISGQGEEPVNFKVHTLVSSVDSVARPTLQGIHQFNGKYGCSFCLRRGRRIERGKGKARVYVGGLGEPRSVQQHWEALNQLERYNANARRGERKTHVRGVKEPTVLLYLSVFSIIRSFVPEYLHSALEGVVSTFLNHWTLPKDSRGKEWYLKKHKRRTLTERLLSIKPPTEVTRAPRGIDQLPFWKASELRSFLLYYSIVCLKGLLPMKYLKHWFLFVYSMTVLLKEKIREEEFDTAKAALHKFVEQIDGLYPNCHRLYTFNVHLLLHIPKSVQDFGSLWASSTFPFEHFNGVLARLIRGTQNVPVQICRSFLRLKQISFTASEVFSKPHASDGGKKLYQSMLGKYYSARSFQFAECLRLFGSAEFYHLSIIEKVEIQEIVGSNISDWAQSYRRLIFKGTVYHAQAYGTLSVRNNSIAKMQNGIIIVLKRILVVTKLESDESYCVVIGEVLDEVDTDELCYDRELDIGASDILYVCETSGRIVAQFPNNIARKCVGVPYGNQWCIIPVVNTVERD